MIKKFRPSFFNFLPYCFIPPFFILLHYWGWPLFFSLVLFWLTELIIFLAAVVFMFSNTYEIHLTRLVVSTGVLDKKEVSVPLSQVMDVTHRLNLLQRIFGVGDIEIGLAGGKQTDIFLLGVRKPQEIVDTILDLKDRKE